MFVEDYKIINPNLSENAFENIKKKCKRLVNQLQNIDWSRNNLVFIYEKENPTDKLTFNKQERISTIIGKELKTFELNSWKDLED